MLRIAVRCTLDKTDVDAALKSFRKLSHSVAPPVVAQITPGDEAQCALAFAMFCEVWNRVPRPDHDWLLLRRKTIRRVLVKCGVGGLPPVVCLTSHTN